MTNSLRSCDALNNKWESSSASPFYFLARRSLPSIISLRILYLVLRRICPRSAVFFSQSAVVPCLCSCVWRPRYSWYAPSEIFFEHHTTIPSECNTPRTGILVQASFWKCFSHFKERLAPNLMLLLIPSYAFCMFVMVSLNTFSSTQLKRFSSVS